MLTIPPPRSPRQKKPAPAVNGPTTPIPPSLTIFSVVRNGSSSYAVTFSNAPSFIAATPNGGFAVNGQPPVSVSAPTGNQVTVSFASSNSGLPWTVSAQPNWLGVPLAFPQSGVTS